MTDRTDFTKKPRTPGEKMREIEERVEALAKRVPHSIGGEWRWKDNALPADPTSNGVIGPGHLVEQRQSPFKVPLDDGAIGPGYHPLPAEPPGSPTVEEAEDMVITKRCCATCKHSNPIEEAEGQLLRCVKFKFDCEQDDGTHCRNWRVKGKRVESITGERIDNGVQYSAEKAIEKRRECSVVFSENGKAWFLVSSESRADEVMRNRPGATKHHLVELREGEGIHDVFWVAGLVNECDKWEARFNEKRDRVAERDEVDAKRRGAEQDRDRLAKENRGLRTLLDEHLNQAAERDKLQTSARELADENDRLAAERDQLQTRVAELDALLDETAVQELQTRVWKLEKVIRRISGFLNDHRATLDHALAPHGGMAAPAKANPND